MLFLRADIHRKETIAFCSILYTDAELQQGSRDGIIFCTDEENITGHIVACLQEGEFRENRKHCGLATKTEERP